MGEGELGEDEMGITDFSLGAKIWSHTGGPRYSTNVRVQLRHRAAYPNSCYIASVKFDIFGWSRKPITIGKKLQKFVLK